MHTSMLPIQEKEDGSKSFNVSKHQKGKDYFRGFLDRFYDHMRERYPDKDLQRTDPNRDHEKKLSVREYKENQDFKRELEQEHKRLFTRNEKLKAIGKELDRAYEKSETAYRYNLEVERYCQEQGITIGQYEKQCFWADRDWGNYPEPERYNPNRNIEPEREAPTHSEWSMKDNSRRCPPETRCVSDGR